MQCLRALCYGAFRVLVVVIASTAQLIVYKCVLIEILYNFQIAQTSELVGELEDMSSLQSEYATDDHIYQAKIQVT